MAYMTDVRHIYLDWHGICHIVAHEQTGYVFTLCNSMQSGESTTEWPLKPRVCRECRKVLKRAVVTY